MKTSDYGFLLFKTNYSESSLMLTFYTQKSGISNFIYKGAKKNQFHFLFLGTMKSHHIKGQKVIWE